MNPEIVITIKDFDHICRICLDKSEEMISLLSKDLTYRFHYFTNITIVENDNLPHSICKECHNKLNNCFDFKLICLNSEELLQKTLENEAGIELPNNLHANLKESNNDDSNDYSPVDITEEDISENSLIDVKVETVKCKICKKVVKQRTYDQHLRRHEKPIKYKCDSCPKAYRQPCELATHKERTHKAQGTITCEVCKKVFLLQAQLDFHLRKHFKKKYTCDVCDKVFFRSTMLARHREIHVNERKQYSCSQCDASFLVELSLKKHIANKHTDKPIEKKVCNICGLAVVNLRPHTLLKHTTGPQYKCEHCNRAFLYRSQWMNHVKEKHEGVPKQKKALCITCGKSFPSPGYLKKHLSTHSEDRNFKCHLCPKQYKKSDHLRVHLRVHSGFRPHVCSYCSKAFHTSTILKNHIRTHTGEKPFSCYVCNRPFSHSGALITHMKIHNGI